MAPQSNSPLRRLLMEAHQPIQVPKAWASNAPVIPGPPPDETLAAVLKAPRIG